MRCSKYKSEKSIIGKIHTWQLRQVSIEIFHITVLAIIFGQTFRINTPLYTPTHQLPELAIYAIKRNPLLAATLNLLSSITCVNF